jgi:hypothetical protein
MRSKRHPRTRRTREIDNNLQLAEAASCVSVTGHLRRSNRRLNACRRDELASIFPNAEYHTTGLQQLDLDQAREIFAYDFYSNLSDPSSFRFAYGFAFEMPTDVAAAAAAAAAVVFRRRSICRRTINSIFLDARTPYTV